jgi:DNA-binding CsgD family transcriptional regulator
LSETSAETESKPKRAKLDRSRRRRLEARKTKAERNVRLFNLLKSGVPIAEIALQEGLSIRRARELVQDMLARREVDPPAGFAQLQIGRLSDAMMVAYAAMMEGNMHALDRVLRIVGELDRYHGFHGVAAQPAAGATPALAAPAPALALPAPGETAEKCLAKD